MRAAAADDEPLSTADALVSGAGSQGFVRRRLPSRGDGRRVKAAGQGDLIACVGLYSCDQGGHDEFRLKPPVCPGQLIVSSADHLR
ncbi:hypothetical protein DN550_32030, partial [Burkholderia multivorans]